MTRMERQRINSLRRKTAAFVLASLLAISVLSAQSYEAEQRRLESTLERAQAEIVALQNLNRVQNADNDQMAEMLAAANADTEPTEDTGWQLIRMTKDYDELCRIVEAEAGGEPFEGKVAVAEVVLNRVDSPDFPGTIHDVIFQPGQFDPLDDGRFYTITVSPESRQAVDRALRERTTPALYFMNPKTSGPVSRGWASRLEHINTIGLHAFYK
jgi:spore germination cell wall hydrolase CwlJ-like protein